jgi:hypothetical protein
MLVYLFLSLNLDFFNPEVGRWLLCPLPAHILEGLRKTVKRLSHGSRYPNPHSNQTSLEYMSEASLTLDHISWLNRDILVQFCILSQHAHPPTSAGDDLNRRWYVIQCVHEVPSEF